MPKPRLNRISTKRETEIRPNTRTGAKTPQILKSSAEARRLIKATLKKCKGNQSEAARRLKLPNQSQLRKILLGQISDTPAMRAALKRADARARKAWLMEHRVEPAALDREIALQVITKIERDVHLVKEMLQLNGKPPEANNGQPPNPTL